MTAQPTDPYNLIQGNWPQESATAYLNAALTLLGQIDTYVDAAADVMVTVTKTPIPAAARKALDFARTLDAHAGMTERAAAALADMAVALIGTTQAITHLVRQGTQVIAAGSNPEAREQYRSQVAEVFQEYMRKGDAVTAALPAERSE